MSPLRLMVVACAAMMLFACSEPVSSEQFLRSDGTGEYAFQVNMSDTTASYDIFFYTAIDKPLFKPDTLRSFPLQLIWRSPSGLYFSETVSFPADSVKLCYRSGMVPSEAGEWTIQASVAPEPAGMRGLGVVVAKNKMHIFTE